MLVTRLQPPRTNSFEPMAAWVECWLRYHLRCSMREIQLRPPVGGHVVLEHAVGVGLPVGLSMDGVDATIVAAVDDEPGPFRQVGRARVGIPAGIVAKGAAVGPAVGPQGPHPKI